jgi:hypothetical protein
MALAFCVRDQEEFDDLIANEEHEVLEEETAQRYQRVAALRRCGLAGGVDRYYDVA